MDAELICPQNKTHQLIFKDPYDQGMLALPVLQVRPAGFPEMWGELAPGVRLAPAADGMRVVNYSNGGELEVSQHLVGVFRRFEAGTSLAAAFQAQSVWDEQTFARFVAFLYRNDYIWISRANAAPRAQGLAREEAYVVSRR